MKIQQQFPFKCRHINEFKCMENAKQDVPLSDKTNNKGYLPQARPHNRKCKEPAVAQGDSPTRPHNRMYYSPERLHARVSLEQVQAASILSSWILRDKQISCSLLGGEMQPWHPLVMVSWVQQPSPPGFSRTRWCWLSPTASKVSSTVSWSGKCWDGWGDRMAEFPLHLLISRFSWCRDVLFWG